MSVFAIMVFAGEPTHPCPSVNINRTCPEESARFIRCKIRSRFLFLFLFPSLSLFLSLFRSLFLSPLFFLFLVFWPWAVLITTLLVAIIELGVKLAAIFLVAEVLEWSNDGLAPVLAVAEDRIAIRRVCGEEGMPVSQCGGDGDTDDVANPSRTGASGKADFEWEVEGSSLPGGEIHGGVATEQAHALLSRLGLSLFKGHWIGEKWDGEGERDEHV